MTRKRAPRADPATLAALTADPQNRRTHNQRNLDAIASSLKEVGAARSIVIDEDDVILAGNGVTQAAQSAGLTKLRVIEATGDEIIAVRRRGLTPDQKRALAIGDNRTAELASWDVAQLLADQAAGLELGAWWTDEELAALLTPNGGPKEGKTDPDAVPRGRATDVQRGDLFALGAHRLLCGDATDAADVARVMGSEKADMVFADPPYGMGHEPHDTGIPKGDWCNQPKNYRPVTGDDAPYDPGPLLAIIGKCREVFFWGADYYADRIAARDGGSWFVWDKRAGLEDVQWSTSEFELCWSKTRHHRQIVRIRWSGLTGMEHDDMKKRVHPTQKPAELARWFVDRFTPADAIIIDPYLGAGASLIAAEQLTRACRAIEIEPQYVQVALDRWEAFTGQRAQKVGEAVRSSVTPASVTHGRTKNTPNATKRHQTPPAAHAPPPQPAPARRRREKARAR